MSPHFIPDHITKVSPKEIYDALERAWLTRFGTPAERRSLLTLLAQWDIETAAGASMHCWNVGNAKSREGDGRSWTFFRCWELINGKKRWFDPPHPQTRFRAFATLADGVTDYLAMLHTRFCAAWPAVVAGDPTAFAHLLKMQGYYTADEAQYASALLSRFNGYAKTLTVKTEAEPDLENPKAIQTVLIALGYDLGPSGADGQLGVKTQSALRAFQKAMGLATDGIAGPKTKAKLLEAWRAHG